MTREEAVSHLTPTTPTNAMPAVAASGTIEAVDGADETAGPPDHIARDVAFDDDGYVAPKKSRTGLIAAVVLVLVLLTAGGFWMSQRGGSEPTTAATPPLGSPINVDSMAATTPSAIPESTTVAAALPAIDSTAIKDSIRKARREAQKKALAQAESVRIAQSKKAASAAGTSTTAAAQSDLTTKARHAAAAMLSNASATKAFNEGATHMGGVLGSKRKGDLQTQIDAIAPFLSQAGIGYAQFKELVKGSGVELFDQYGRMLPDALRRFANSQ